MLKDFFSSIFFRLTIVTELLRTLWKYKLWWSLPIIILLLCTMLLLLIAGHSGIVAFIYPLF